MTSVKKIIDKNNSSIDSILYQLGNPSVTNSEAFPDTLYEGIHTATYTEPWGAFIITGSNSQWKDIQYSKIALAGSYLFSKEKTEENTPEDSLENTLEN